MAVPTTALFYGKQVEFADNPEFEATASMPFAEWLAWDHGPRLTEWIDGRVFVYMSVSDAHDRVVGFLRTLLTAYAELTGSCFVRGGPYAMAAKEGGPGREPDLIVVLAGHASRLGESHLAGPPDIAIEVVSEDSVRRDRVVKFAEYAAAGVPEYWVIDPRPGRERADFFLLPPGDAAYVPADTTDGVFRSAVLPGFWLRPGWLWEDEPRPIAALREVLAGRI